ncbi:hypothetical protein DM02DRAFT_170606 [Periconia macrospinosa]|uniref:Uncharacterized protein n=1 Tax=Periconia macrospinosa TaxID=97972 RepID=A0A2V1DAA7_9PLEO|nr:hypothetical protein DM02DRAFT_170606 [Periconia macrospinosa]
MNLLSCSLVRKAVACRPDLRPPPTVTSCGGAASMADPGRAGDDFRHTPALQLWASEVVTCRPLCSASCFKILLRCCRNCSSI